MKFLDRVTVMSRRSVEDSDQEKDIFFFSTDHCQGVKGFVPCTFYLPHEVVPRECLPDGIVCDKQDIINIYFSDGVEIPNPNPDCQG